MAFEKTKSEHYLMGGRNTKASIYANSMIEFREVMNLNFTIHGALNQRPGSSLYSTGQAFLSQTNVITGLNEFARLNGSSYLLGVGGGTIFQITTTGYSGFVYFGGSVKPTLMIGFNANFANFVDRSFVANGDLIVKTDGTNLFTYSLPGGTSIRGGANWGLTQALGGSLMNGVTGVFSAAFGFINERGFFGPAGAALTIIIDGITFNSIQYVNMKFPIGGDYSQADGNNPFGISAMQLYRTSSNGALLTGTTQIGWSTGVFNFTDTGSPLGTRLAPLYGYFTLIPRYLEIFNNQLFMAGFSGFLSTTFFSDIGEPEGVEPQNFIEWRTNDSDRIMGMKTYGGQMVVAKERSFHRLSGQNPSNFLTEQLSGEYGCLSHRAMVVFEDRLWFLDTKGVCEFNGANIKIVSVRVEDVFATMNISAARENACAIHYKTLNEVWFSIPTDGSTTNNTIVVYDYVADQWTVYKGLNASVLALAKQGVNTQLPFFGGYSSQVFFVSPTFINDNGAAITCSIKTRFDSPRDQTTEDMFRRFYLNINPVLGITLPMTVNLQTNYGTTIQITQQLYRNQFQSRIDFGLSARSIQAQVIHSSASFPLTIFGYTWESRFQRPV